MHLKFSHKILMVLLPILIPSISIAQFVIQPDENAQIQEIDGLLYTFSNFTRPKRQLFREDIPHDRPLSGNVYALHHGWPHPGRWSDGLRSKHRPNPNLPRPHQHFIDMLERPRPHQGTRQGRYHHDINHNNHENHLPPMFHQPQNPHSVNFGSDIFHSSGGVGSAEGYGPPKQQHNIGPIEHEQGGPDYDGPSGPDGHERPNHYEGPGSGVGPGPGKRPSYIPVIPKGHRPKTVVHYHPVQYGNILNFPPQQGHNEGHGPAYGPPEGHNEGQGPAYGPPEGHNEGPAYGPPEGHNEGPGYGPPNHESGEPLGPNIQSGFIPSKGLAFDSPGGQQHPRPFKNSPQRDVFRFDPFKIFSSRPPKLPAIEHDVPVAIPILAQFHTAAKPVKFSKVKRPIHLVYGHGPPNHGRRRPPTFFQHNFLSRPPTKQHSQWLLQHGLK